VDASDSMCRCIGKIIARYLRLVASRLYRMAVTRPGSRAAVTRGDFTFEVSWRAGWWRSILKGGTPEAVASFRGQPVILRMDGRQTIVVGCSAQCMLYSVYAVLSVNS